MTHIHRTQKGFTLIELAIVLIIVSFLIAGFLQGFYLFVKQKQNSDLEETFDSVQEGLRNFILHDPNPLDALQETNTRYPCPASPTASPYSAAYGEEVCPTGGVGTCENDVCVVAGTTGPVFIGAVPSKTLGISASHALDPYKNRLSYAVTEALTVQGTLGGGTPSVGAITIDPTIGGAPIIDAHFAIITHGEDGAGSYTAAGVPNAIPCRIGEGGDAENCDNDAIFSELGRSTGDTPNFYDDTVAFTLSDGSADSYWGPIDDNPQNIHNLNETGVVWIGPTPDPAAAPTNTSLAVSNDMLVTQNILAGQDISADGVIRVNADCAPGEVLTGIVNGVAQCQSIADLLTAVFACDPGQALVFDNTGAPICAIPEGYIEVFNGSSPSVTNNWGTGNFIIIGKNPSNNYISSRTMTIVSTADIRVASADAGGASVNIVLWDKPTNAFTFSFNNIIRIYHQPLPESS